MPLLFAVLHQRHPIALVDAPTIEKASELAHELLDEGRLSSRLPCDADLTFRPAAAAERREWQNVVVDGDDFILYDGTATPRRDIAEDLRFGYRR
jgi:hypothetical protein